MTGCVRSRSCGAQARLGPPCRVPASGPRRVRLGINSDDAGPGTGSIGCASPRTTWRWVVSTIVYVPLGAEGFEFCHPVHEGDFETIKVQIDGSRRGQEWSPPQMRLVSEDDGKSLLESDSPWLGSDALIFRKRALQRVGAFLEEHGELLPLRCPDADLAISTLRLSTHLTRPPRPSCGSRAGESCTSRSTSSEGTW